jgi:hypothetical protein
VETDLPKSASRPILFQKKNLLLDGLKLCGSCGSPSIHSVAFVITYAGQPRCAQA